MFFSIYLLYGVFTTLKKCIFHFLNQAQLVSERREEPSKLKNRPWQRKVSIGQMWNCDGGRHDDGEEVSIDNHEFYLQIPPKFDQLPAKSSNGFDDVDDDDDDGDDLMLHLNMMLLRKMI